MSQTSAALRQAEEIPQAAALRFQLACIVGHEPASSFVEIRPLARDGRIAAAERSFVPCRRTAEIAARGLQLAKRHNVFIGVCARVSESGKAEAVERAWCLWADCDDDHALERLARFQPRPSIVVRSGTGAHAYWSLGRAIDPAWCQRANRRLAQALGADLHATDVARVLRPVGTLNHKHSPPRQVVCTEADLGTYTVAEVVGDLPDTPHYAPRPIREPITADPGRRLAGLLRVVAQAKQGGRNAALFWAACRASERAELNDQARDELRAAALAAGLRDHEITATLRSAGARAA